MADLNVEDLRARFRDERKSSRSLNDLSALMGTPRVEIVNDPAQQITGFSPVIPDIDAEAPLVKVEDVLPTAPQHIEATTLKPSHSTKAGTTVKEEEKKCETERKEEERRGEERRGDERQEQKERKFIGAWRGRGRGAGRGRGGGEQRERRPAPKRRGHTRHTSLCDSSAVLNARVLPQPQRRGRGLRHQSSAAPALPPRSPLHGGESGEESGDSGTDEVKEKRESEDMEEFEAANESQREKERTVEERERALVTEAKSPDVQVERRERRSSSTHRPLLSEQRSTSQPALKQNLTARLPQSRGSTQSGARLQPLRKGPTSPVATCAPQASVPAENTARRFAPLLTEKLQKFLDTHANLAKATAAHAKQLEAYAELRLATHPKDEAVLRCATTSSALLKKLSEEMSGMCSSAAEDSKRKQQEQRPDLRALGNILDTLRALHHMYSNSSEAFNSSVPAMLEYRSRVSAVELSDMDEVGDEVQDGTDVVKQGHLWKKGVSRRNWKFRWFILKPRVMYYFNNEKDKKLLGTVSLVNCTVGAVNIRRPHCFAVSSRDRIFQMSAADDRERADWMSAIMKCIEIDMGGDQAKLAVISRQHSLTVAERQPEAEPEAAAGSLHVGFAGATTVQQRRHPSPQIRKLQMKSASSDILRAMAKSVTRKAETIRAQEQGQEQEEQRQQRRQQQKQQEEEEVKGPQQEPPPAFSARATREQEQELEQDEAPAHMAEEEHSSQETAPEEAAARLAEVNKRYSVQYVWMRNDSG